jgi:hypothetical protein
VKGFPIQADVSPYEAALRLVSAGVSPVEAADSLRWMIPWTWDKPIASPDSAPRFLHQWWDFAAMRLVRLTQRRGNSCVHICSIGQRHTAAMKRTWKSRSFSWDRRGMCYGKYWRFGWTDVSASAANNCGINWRRHESSAKTIAEDGLAPFPLSTANEQRRVSDGANGHRKTRTGVRLGQDLRLADFPQVLPTRNYRVE